MVDNRLWHKLCPDNNNNNNKIDYSVQNDTHCADTIQEWKMLRETAPKEVSIEAAVKDRQARGCRLHVADCSKHASRRPEMLDR